MSVGNKQAATPVHPGFYWLRAGRHSDWQIVKLSVGPMGRVKWFDAGTMTLGDFEREFPEAVWGDRLQHAEAVAS